jgi:Kef-type K+ transport system membrane component KefB
LELEYERLKSVGRDAFRLGGAQFLLTSAAFFGAASAAGLTAPAALVLGGGLALSSSAFVIQLLSEKGEGAKGPRWGDYTTVRRGWEGVLVLGGGLALSSSAFVIQLLSEKGEGAKGPRVGRLHYC